MPLMAPLFRMRLIRLAAMAVMLTALCSWVAINSPGARAAELCPFSDIVDAIQSANSAAPDPASVELTADCLYIYDGPTTFTDSDSSLSALPELTGNLTIKGNGAAIERSVNAPVARIFSIATSGNLQLNGVTIDNGKAENGGGIANFGGHLKLFESGVGFNEATSGFGGGIVNLGTAEIVDSIISNNSGPIGAGVANLGGSMTITSSSVVSNTASFGPGQIYNTGPLLGDGTLTLVNSTVVGFQKSFADVGVVNIGTFNAYNSTIVLNGGGGINNQGGSAQAPAVTTLVNTIVAGNGTADCDTSQTQVGSIVDSGHNLDSDGSCGLSADNHSLSNSDPGFSPQGLGFYGGPTSVIGLVSTSPAVDAGDDAVCAAEPVNGLDQRGVMRPQGAHCDIGAFEVLAPVVTANDANAQGDDTSVQLSASAAFNCGASFTSCPETVDGTITFSVTDSNNDPVGTSLSGAITGGSASVVFNPFGLTLGTYTITATYHDSTNTYADNTDTAVLTILAGPAASITLSPGNTSGVVGGSVTEVATVLDENGYPVVDGTLVQYTVSGANSASGSVPTLNGQVTISYSGTFAGTDTLTVTAQGGTNPSSSAQIAWSAPASTPRASLTIMSLFGSQVQAMVSVGRTGQPSGSFSYADRSVRLNNVQLSGLVVSGSNATLYGTARLSDGSNVSFRLEVTASRSGGTLRLTLSNGYDSGRISAPVVRIEP